MQMGGMVFKQFNTERQKYGLNAEHSSTVNESLRNLWRGTAGCCLATRLSVFEQQT